MTEILGRLTRVDPRTVWQSEPQDFTPWLSENLDLLAEALGLDDLELVERERPVGAFALDIHAQESGPGGRTVVIENQLEKTDHSHLGQLLLYAAGLEADIAVWVTPQFRDEYRETLDWLNSHTRKDVSFFGVEVELLRVGESPPAPNFRVVAEPSDFQRTVGASPSSGISDRQTAYHAFFARLIERLNDAHPGFTNRRTAGYTNWMSFPIGRSGVRVAVSFSSGNVFRIELYIDAGDHDTNKRAFDSLRRQSAAFERQLGDLTWQRLDHRRASRIFLGREGSIDDPPAVLTELIGWGAENAIRLREVFEGPVRQLDLTPDPDSEGETEIDEHR